MTKMSFLLAPKGAVFIASKMGQSSIKSKFERQKRRERVGIVARSGKARYGEQVKNRGKGKTRQLICQLSWACIFSCYTPEPASLWLMLAFSPDNGDIEVNPEEDVDDEDGDEGPGRPRDCLVASLTVEPDVTS